MQAILGFLQEFAFQQARRASDSSRPISASVAGSSASNRFCTMVHKRGSPSSSTNSQSFALRGPPLRNERHIQIFQSLDKVSPSCGLRRVEVCPTKARALPAALVVFFHGRAGNRGEVVGRVLQKAQQRDPAAAIGRKPNAAARIVCLGSPRQTQNALLNQIVLVSLGVVRAVERVGCRASAPDQDLLKSRYSRLYFIRLNPIGELILITGGCGGQSRRMGSRAGTNLPMALGPALPKRQHWPRFQILLRGQRTAALTGLACVWGARERRGADRSASGGANADAFGKDRPRRFAKCLHTINRSPPALKSGRVGGRSRVAVRRRRCFLEAIFSSGLPIAPCKLRWGEALFFERFKRRFRFIVRSIFLRICRFVPSTDPRQRQRERDAPYRR